jgi:DNA-binding transcriptional LysR family regulator
LGEVLELRLMRYFVAVAEELNFSRAATRLHMAQPPLSVAIRQLEQQVGTDLFVRTTREVRLTEAGHAFLDGARRTLAEADRAVEAAKRVAAGELGQLRLAFSWSARFETLPALARAFKARHPDVELLGQEMWNAHMIPALRAGTIDAAVSLCPEAGSGIESEPVRREPIVLVSVAREPPAAAGTVALATLTDRTFLLFPRELAPRLYDVLVDMCRQAGFEPRVRNESFHTSWDADLFAQGSVVALAPRSIAAGLKDGVTAVPLSDPAGELETRLVWRADHSSPALEAFRSIARSTY